MRTGNMAEAKIFFDTRVEQGEDGSCRGKVWVARSDGKISELHFDAANWEDARMLAVAFLEVHKKHASPLIRV